MVVGFMFLLLFSSRWMFRITPGVQNPHRCEVFDECCPIVEFLDCIAVTVCVLKFIGYKMFFFVQICIILCQHFQQTSNNVFSPIFYLPGSNEPGGKMFCVVCTILPCTALQLYYTLHVGLARYVKHRV